MNNSFCEETDLMFPNKQLKTLMWSSPNQRDKEVAAED